MDGTVSGIITVVLLVLFVGGWAWAWSSRRKATFDKAARMPLEDEPIDEAPGQDAPVDARGRGTQP